MSDNHAPKLNWLKPIALGMLVIGLIGSGAGFVLAKKDFFHSYLLGFVYWGSIAFGCLPLLMIQHLTSGGWGFSIRRILEAAVKTIPVLLILFVPIFFGMGELYEWARPEAAGDAILAWKRPYLNTTAYMVRWAIYLAIWGGMAILLTGWSKKQDQANSLDEQLALSTNCQRVSAIGLVIFALTMTFGSVDWLMSLTPHWFSTIWGLLIIIGELLSAMAFSILILYFLREEEPLASRVKPVNFHDNGKLMLAFVMVWTYFQLSQYLITWSANLPEEITWYLDKFEGGWLWYTRFLLVGHFVLPFLLLLSRMRKRNITRLSKVAMFVLFMRMCDLFWDIRPNVTVHTAHHGFTISWTDIVVPLFFGGVFLFLFVMNLQSMPLLPLHDPHYKEKTGHGH